MKHIFKKALSLLLAGILMLSAFSLIAFADGDTVVGYSSARVVKKDLSAVADILTFNAAAAATEYKITSNEGLVKLSTLVNEGNKFEGITVYLATDLNMENVTMEPIGNFEAAGDIAAVNTAPTYYFAGTFDGQGHIIDNLVMHDETNNIFTVNALFGNNIGLTVKNLILGEGCSFAWKGTLDDANRHPFVGAVAAKAQDAVFENIWTMATIAGGRMSASIVARMNGAVDVINCTNTGSVEGMQCAGGIGGFGGTNLKFENCRNAGDVTSPAAKSYGDPAGRCAAGILGRLQAGSASVKGCINSGKITGTFFAGGIGGVFQAAYTAQNNTNYGAVTQVTPTNLTSGQTAPTPATSYLIATASAAGTVASNSDKTGQTDVWTPETIVPNYPAPSAPVVPAPAADYVGYTSTRVEKKDMAPIPNILKFEEIKSNEYKITTPDGLVKLGALVKSEAVDFTGITIYLANDLDMSTVENFEPIGGGSSKTAYFNGTFDGQGNMIENLTVDSKAEGFNVGDNLNMVFVGLFAVLADATVKNLIIGENCSFTYSNSETYGVLTPDKAKKEPYIGAIAGGIEKGSGDGVIIDNCWNRATVTNTATVNDNRWHSAGIVARVTGDKNVIKNTTNSGNITDYVNAAGFATMVMGQLTIENSRNTGTITMTSGQGNAWFTAAGFVSRPAGNNMVAIKGCINNGDIVGPKNIGSFMGTLMHNGQALLDCTNYGTYSSTTNVGLVGQAVATSGYYDSANPDNNVKYTMTNCVDKAGETDASLVFETITPDYTPVPDPIPTPDDDDEENTTAPDDGEETTEPAEVTTAPDGDDTTKVPDGEETTAAPKDGEGGCKSALAGSIAVLAIIATGAAVAAKKKH